MIQCTKRSVSIDLMIETKEIINGDGQTHPEVNINVSFYGENLHLYLLSLGYPLYPHMLCVLPRVMWVCLIPGNLRRIEIRDTIETMATLLALSELCQTYQISNLIS